MTENIWKKISYTFGLLPLGVLFGIVAYTGHLEIKDLDLWLHLAAGKFITAHGYVPDVDFLSHTISGRPWDNHEWLFQVIIYNIFSRWGFEGLQFMQSTVVTLTMLVLLFIGYSKERQTVMTFMLILVYLVFSLRFTFRPDIFSLMFFAFYILLLAVHVDKKWMLGALVFVQILWVNMHGFFFFGPVFVLIGVASEWIKRRVRLPAEWNETGRLTDDEYRRLKWGFVLVVIACLFNPGFVRGALYPVGVFFSISGDSSIFFEYIQELKKPILLDNIFDTSQSVYYKLLIVFSTLSFLINRRRIDVSALLFWLVFLFFSLKAVRNVAYFSFAAYLVIINNLYSLNTDDVMPFKFSHPKFKYMTSAIFKLFIFFWLLQYADALRDRGYYDFDRYERKSEFGGVSQRSYPNKAADFLVENRIRGNFFNDFNSGAYLLGRAFPDIKVYIDGRTELYGPEYFKRYWRIHNEDAADLFEEDVAKYNLTAVFLNSSSDHIPRKFLRYLYNNKDWKPVYFDYDGIIFLKDIPQNRAWIDRHYVDLANWQPLRLDLNKIGATSVVPYRNFYRAYTLESIGLLEAARGEAEAALEVDPAYAAALGLVGKVLAKQGNYEEAFKRFRVAAMYAPQDKEARYNLAMIYLDLKQYDYAVAQFKRILTLWPGEIKAYFLIAKAYIRNRDFDTALLAINEGLARDPQAARDVKGLGDLMMEEGQLLEAARLYEKAKAINPKTEELYVKLAEALVKLEKPGDARKILEEGLGLWPEDAGIKNALKEYGFEIY